MKYDDYQKIKWFDEFVNICAVDVYRVPEYYDNPILEYLEQINDCRWVDECEITALRNEIHKRQLKIYRTKLKIKSNIIKKLMEKRYENKNKINDEKNRNFK